MTIRRIGSSRGFLDRLEGAFYPTKIPGLKVFYSADYEKTLVADGASMTMLHDLSGNGNDASIASNPFMRYTGGPDNGPYFETSATRYFNLPAGIFTGITAASGVTGFIVAKAGAADGFWNFSSSGSLSHFGYGGVVYDTFMMNGNRQDSIVAVTTGQWYRYQPMNKTGSFKVRLNGAQVFSGASPSFTATPSNRRLGSSDGSGYGLPGFSVFGLYDHELTTDEQSAFDAWLATHRSGGTP